MAKFIALHASYYNATGLMDVCVNTDKIRSMEVVYTDDPAYDKGIRSQIVFSESHAIGVAETINQILFLIEEAK